MEFLTPFGLFNGNFRDRHFHEFRLSPLVTPLPDSLEEAETLVNRCRENQINYLHLELDENKLTLEKGALAGNQALAPLDLILERTHDAKIYLGLTPITSWCRERDGRSEHSIREDEPIRAERYLEGLFTHINQFSGRMFCDHENIAAIEYIIGLETFDKTRLRTWIHHLRAFVEIHFGNRLVNLYLSHRGAIPEELRSAYLEYGKFNPVALIPEPDKLCFLQKLPGLPRALFTGYVRENGTRLWHEMAISEATSQHEDPHRNGGAEGWCGIESAVPVDFRFKFSVPVKEAKFRPSLRNPVTLQVGANLVEFTLEKKRYGVLEVNYKSPELPAFTVYVFNDALMEAPVIGVQYMEPGYHRQEELGYDAEKTLYFKPGEHRIEGNRLRPVSNHDIFLAPGAVVKAGIVAEECENVKIYGYGVLDGSLVPRMPGENWKGRADDAFVHFYRGKNIELNGVVLYASPFWNIVPEGTSNCVIRNHKAITWLVNTDGVQPRSCVNLRVENCFFKCADDCIAVKTRRAQGMHSHHLIFQDLVCWNDGGSALEIGHTSQADLLEDVEFKNIECIRISACACSICLIDHSTVCNVRYEHIYVEQNLNHRPELSFNIAKNFYSTDSERARINEISIKNLHIEDKSIGGYFTGFNREHIIDNVTVEDVLEHGPDGQIKKASEFSINQNEFCRNIKVRL